MKTLFKTVLVCSVISTLLVRSTSAQTVLTSGDVGGGLTLSNAVIAAAFDTTSSFTLQGVTFQGAGTAAASTGTTGQSVTNGGITLSLTPVTSDFVVTAPATFSSTPDANDTALTGILSHFAYSGGGFNTMTFTLTGLADSSSYTLDFLVDVGTAYAPRSEAFSSVTPSGSTVTTGNQVYSSGTSAYLSTLTLTSTAAGTLTGTIVTGSGPIINGIAVLAAPEPRAWVLMGMGLLFLGAFGRRRLRA